MDEWKAELGALAAEVAEHLRYELDVGGIGLPPREAPAADALAAAPASAASPQSAAPQAPAPESPELARPIASPPEAAARALPTTTLVELAREAADCTRCRLHEGRTRSVFSRGAPDAPLVFVGEGPGYNEDQQGEPFVGKAGQLLDKMIAAMGFGAAEVYICNVVKCRPPENRTPLPDEVAACLPFLEAQLERVAPQVIVALGRPAAEALGVIEPGGRGWRGRWASYRGVPVLATYHPAYLLRSPEQKRSVWEDLQTVVAKMGRELPARRR